MRRLNMEETIEELKLKFIEIKKRNWIEGTSHGKGNVGITFENLIGKERENLPIADYNGIEIKTSLKYIKYYSRANVTLFSATFDGPYIYGSQYLKTQYGWYDKILPKYKVFYATISANKLTRVNNHYFMKLEINYFYQKIYLVILNQHYQLIEKCCFWSFKTLKEKLDAKIKYLAFIETEKKKEKNIVYFRYTNINFYKIKDFSTFLSLIEKGEIKIAFNIGIYRNGKKIGQTYDHGTNFEIRKENISMLYQHL